MEIVCQYLTKYKVSNVQIPAYAGLLSVNAALILRIAIKSLLNKFCDIYVWYIFFWHAWFWSPF